MENIIHGSFYTVSHIFSQGIFSDHSVFSLVARHLGIMEATVHKWRSHTEFHDCSSTARRLQTTLTPAQAAISPACFKSPD